MPDIFCKRTSKGGKAGSAEQRGRTDHAVRRTGSGAAILQHVVAVAIFGAAALVGPAAAQDAPVDFSGKTIELIVPFPDGGGSSTHARLVAPLLAEELPGKPTIVIQNVEGGGSVRGVNLFAERAKPDGLMIASIATGTYYRYILKDPAVNYPLPDFIPFLTSPYGMVSFGRTDFGFSGDPVADVKFLRENPPVLAGSGPADADMPHLYCLDLLGIKVKPVFGLSTAEAAQALERGESQIGYANTASWEGTVKPLVDEGTVKTLFTMGYQQPDGKVTRDPLLPDAPTCLELYEQVNGEPLSGPRLEVYNAMFAIRMIVAKTFVLPPGTPDAIVQTYVEAMKRAIARPEMQTPQAVAALGGYPQSTGAQAIAGHKAGAAMAPEAQAELIRWLKDVYDVQPN
jgi:putative tricarboxylic transport membrane protein